MHAGFHTVGVVTLARNPAYDPGGTWYGLYSLSHVHCSSYLIEAWKTNNCMDN